MLAVDRAECLALSHGRFSSAMLIQYEAGWAPELVWTLWKIENSSPFRESNKIRRLSSPWLSHYTD
jgi:hypothetical protein